MRPKSQIFTPKRDDEHPLMGVTPPGFSSAKREVCTCFPPLSTNFTNPIFLRYKKKTATKKTVHSYKYKSLKENFLLEQYVKSHTVQEMPPVTPCTFYFKHFPQSYTPCIFFTGMHGNFIYTGYFLQVHLHSSTEKLPT